MSETAKPGPVTKVMTAVLIFQLVLCALLFLGDLGPGFSLPGRGPKAPVFDTPTSPGDQTRRYDPANLPLTSPADPTGAPATPMPKRLMLEQTGGRWLLRGAIEAGDGARIADLLRKGIAAAPDDHPSEILLNSPGGSVADALALGRAIRDTGLNTAMRANDICLSACPYLLAAGVERRAAPGAKIGVHQHYFGENTLLPAFIAVSDIQRGQGQVMRYLADMGVDTMLMAEALLTPPDQIYLLSPEELTRYQLLNAPHS